MWVKEGHVPSGQHHPPARPPGPRPLAVFPRGVDAELRVSLAEYQGKPYFALRVYEREPGQGGKLLPSKGKGLSVRLSEAGRLAEVLANVEAGTKPAPRTGELRERTPRPGPTGRGTVESSRGRWNPADTMPSVDRAPFDEFGEEK